MSKERKGVTSVEVAKEKALIAEERIVVVELLENKMLPEKVGSPVIVPVVREETLSEVALRESAEREVNPEAAPADVIFQVEEVMLADLASLPKVIFPEAVRLPPVDIPEEKSPNEAETPEPVWGGEPPPACCGPGI